MRLVHPDRKPQRFMSPSIYKGGALPEEKKVVVELKSFVDTSLMLTNRTSEDIVVNEWVGEAESTEHICFTC